MKKSIILASAAILICFCAFKNPLTIGQAKVKQQQGLYLFHFSEPTNDYKYLGTVKVPGVVWSKDPDTFLKSLMKRCKSDHPSANGLIISDDYEKADAIIISE